MAESGMAKTERHRSPTTPGGGPVLPIARRTRLRHHRLLVRRYRRRDECAGEAIERDIEAELLANGRDHPGFGGAEQPRDYGSVLTCDRVQATNLSPRALRQLLASDHPVVIEGLDVADQARRTWTFESLAARFPSTPVGTLAQRPAGDGGQAGEGGSPHYHHHEVADPTLAEAVNAIAAGGDHYVSATAAIFGDHPELLDEVGLPRLRELLEIHVVRPELFLGSARHRSYYHCALGTNVFLQITGEKDWTFVHPSHTPWMYPNIGHSASGLYIASPVRTESPTTATDHPLYELVPKIGLRTRPGDVLINPSWWWHEVRNRCNTIAVALRTPSIGRLNPLFSAFYLTNPSVLRATGAIVANTVRSGLQGRGRGLVPDTDDGHRRRALYSPGRLDQR